MAFSKTFAYKLLSIILLVCMLFWFFPLLPVSASNTGQVYQVDDVVETYDLTINSVGRCNSDIDNSSSTRFNVPLFRIPEMEVDKEYVIRFKCKAVLENASWQNTYYDSGFKIAYLTGFSPITTDYEYIGGDSNVFYRFDGETSISFRISGIDMAESAWTKWIFLKCAFAGGYVVGTPNTTGKLTLSFTDITYEELIETDNILDELQKQTEIAEEQKETTKGIFGAIKDFFGSFFDNLINMIKSLIIPSSDELLDFLQEVNDWFGDRLGFIWYPFSLMIELVSALSGGDGSQYLTVPALSLNMLGESYTIWNEIQVDMDAFGIFQYVRYFTSALLVAGIVRLASNKWSEWIGGRSAS